MRIITWNINGVRTLPQYHPWNTLKTFDGILDHLDADIICFQEMKSSRLALPKGVAIPPSYDSFFSFPSKKTGYSGVATYTKRSTLVPLKAEEGLTGLLQPKPPLSAEERISKTYPSEFAHLEDDEEDGHGIEPQELDNEGRAITVDFGLFVLINVYCPNNTGTEDRERYKMAYHSLLERRIDILLREGREVIIIGDLNACAAVDDHCEGHIMVSRGQAEGLEGEEGFWGPPHRRSLRSWIRKEGNPEGKLVDIVRDFWPDRKGMYTCWNTKISARASNYGTRIDFILVTPGLVPWVQAADIQPQVKGSDHCPVFVDFKDEIVGNDGSPIKLRDVLCLHPSTSSSTSPDPPRLAAKFWEEYSGKQTLLSTFFGKKSNVSPSEALPLEFSTLEDTPHSTPEIISQPVSPLLPPPSQEPPSSSQRSSPPPIPPLKRKPSMVQEGSKTAPKKHKTITGDKHKHKGKPKQAGQISIASFFAQPKSGSSQPKTSHPPSKSKSTPVDVFAVEEDEEMTLTLDSQTSQPDEDADYRLALQLSQEEERLITSQPTPSQTGDKGKNKEGGGSKKAWGTLLAPLQAPRCFVHDEPTREFTVNKPGPNKGKKFFVCARPVGPGYDKGRSERLREEVNPEWKCGFFKWASEVKKDMMKGTGPCDS